MNLDRVIAVRNTKTIYRDGDKCIKVFNDVHSKSMVLNEALNNSRVEETGLYVPKVHDVTTIDGKWAIVSDYIEGKTLAQIMAEEPENAEKWISFFVEQQLFVHSKNCPMLSKLKDKMNYKILQADLPATTRYDLHTRLEGMPKHSKLCHGDFNTSNVIISDDGTPFIIDWAHATQGNASADAARTFLCFWLDGDIGGADIYLDIFCDKSGTDKRYVQSWMPIVAASQSVKGNEKEREFLLSWVNVVDYE